MSHVTQNWRCVSKVRWNWNQSRWKVNMIGAVQRPALLNAWNWFVAQTKPLPPRFSSIFLKRSSCNLCWVWSGSQNYSVLRGLEKTLPHWSHRARLRTTRWQLPYSRRSALHGVNVHRWGEAIFWAYGAINVCKWTSFMNKSKIYTHVKMLFRVMSAKAVIGPTHGLLSVFANVWFWQKEPPICRRSVELK